MKFGIIPELVGRLPVITTLQDLKKEDLIRILTEPHNALCRQYEQLLDFDQVQLQFEPEALEAAVIGRVLEEGGFPYCHVRLGNTASESLQKKLGLVFDEGRTLCWLE